jgi:hypothetical protein
MHSIQSGFFIWQAFVNTIKPASQKFAAGMPQALKKVMQTPRFANRRAQLAAEWEAKNKLSGGGSFGKVSAAKVTRRSKAKVGSGLPPEAEKEIEEQALSEVGCPIASGGCRCAWKQISR